MPSSAATHRSSLIARSSTGPTTASIIRRSPSRSASRRWCGRIWPARGSCSRSTRKPASQTPSSSTARTGLGESVVQGTVNPDEFYVFKPTLRTGFRPILQKTLGTKEFKLVYEEGGSRQTRSVPVPLADRARFVLDDEDILTLARWAVVVEDHYSSLRGLLSPMDIEWAKDGRSGELFLVQARPETVHARRDPLVLERFHLEAKGQVLATGQSVGERVGQGHVRVIRSSADLQPTAAGRGARDRHDRP